MKFSLQLAFDIYTYIYIYICIMGVGFCFFGFLICLEIDGGTVMATAPIV